MPLQNPLKDTPPAPSDLVIQKAMDFFDKIHNRFKKSNIENKNGMFASIYQGGEVKESLGGACHAGLNSVDYGRGVPVHIGSEVIATITHPLKYCNRPSYSQPPSCKVDSDFFDEVTTAFYSWLTQRSVFAGAIFSDPETSRTRGLIISSHIPSNVLAAICIISRHTREHFGKIASWKMLVDKGVNEEMAFVMVMSNGMFKNNFPSPLPKDEKDYISGGGNASLFSGAVGHNIFTQWGTNVTHINNFVNHVTDAHLNLSYHKETAYQGVNKLWSPLGSQHTRTDWHIKVNELAKKNFEVDKTEKQKIPNPFAVKDPYTDPSSISAQFFLEHLEPICEYLGTPLKHRNTKKEVVSLPEPPIPSNAIPAIRKRKVA